MSSAAMEGGDQARVQPARRREAARRVLLACGVVSSLLYLATDIVGGLLYPGYSFISQTISELGAMGARSKALVDPLFLIYNLLVLAFGVGVFREAEQRRTLRITGALLVTYGALGAVAVIFTTFFSMHQRGTGTLVGDLPHIILTGALVLLVLFAMGFGAFALSKQFRIYTFASILAVIVFGALTVPYASRIAANRPTPGVGIIERLDVFALLLWIAVLAIALWRRRASHAVISSRATPATHIDGFVAPGFQEVRKEFERNFTERGEIGAAVAAYWRGEKVVDLWGGRRTPEGDERWYQDTMIVVNSTTKGLAAMALAVANARGWLDYDARVARYWPEFAQNGKADVTVRQLLAHEAGLALLDEKLTLEKIRDLDYLADLLARQRPAWLPGTRHGYHGMTLGLYMQELIRRVDPAQRTLGRFFHEEIAEPLQLDFYIGLPPDIPEHRLAKSKPFSRWRALKAFRYATPGLVRKIVGPRSLLRRSLALSAGMDFNERPWLEVELPAGNGVGTARAIARAYSAFAEGGAELGITPETFARITAPPVVARPRDEIIGLPSYFSLGFLRPGPETAFGSSPRAFGAPGAGGSFGFADPDLHLGYAYIMNKLDFYLIDDPREKALRDALYSAIRLSAGSEAANRDSVKIGAEG